MCQKLLFDPNIWQLFSEVLLPISCRQSHSLLCQDVSFIQLLPIAEGGRYLDFFINGGTPPPGDGRLNAPHYVVSDDYLDAAGLPLVQGRTFRATDTAESETVGLISETAARRFWPGESPIGHRIGYGSSSTRQRLTIVGVTGDLKVAGLQYDTFPQIYVLQRQTERLWGATDDTGTILVRSPVALETLVPELRRTVAALDPSVPITSVRTLADVINQSVARPRFVAHLLGSFALVALLLAAVGIYGVVSYTVARSTRDTAVRLALGADRAAVSLPNRLSRAERAYGSARGDGRSYQPLVCRRQNFRHSDRLP